MQSNVDKKEVFDHKKENQSDENDFRAQSPVLKKNILSLKLKQQKNSLATFQSCQQISEKDFEDCSQGIASDKYEWSQVSSDSSKNLSDDEDNGEYNHDTRNSVKLNFASMK